MRAIEFIIETTDYQRRRQRERDVDLGKPVAKQRTPKQTDYQKRRAQYKKDLDLGEQAVAEGSLAEALSDTNFKPAGDYKNYAIEIRKKPFVNKTTGEKYYIAQTQIGKDEFKAKGVDVESALTAIKSRIDQVLNAATKVSSGATLDFNVKFVSDILSNPREQFFAKVVNINGQPKLVIAGDEMLEFGRELMQLGFKPSSLRLDTESDQAIPLPGISYSKNQMANTGLIANGRYEIGNMTTDDDGNRVFDLKYHSTVHSPSDKMRLKVPALTVGSNRTAADEQGVAEGICSECGGPSYSDQILAEKQDACYHKVRSRYKVWPSAYASGALVQCRKKGAANWGNKSKK